MHQLLDQRADDHHADTDRDRVPADGRVDVEHDLLAGLLADAFGTGGRGDQAGGEVAGGRSEEPGAHDQRRHM